MKRTFTLILAALAAAALFGGLVHAVLVAAHVSEPATTTVYGLTPRRFWATAAAGLALVGVVIGGLALRRSAGRIGTGSERLGAIVALAAGLIALVWLSQKELESRSERTFVIHVEFPTRSAHRPRKWARISRLQLAATVFGNDSRVRLVGEEHGMDALEIDHIEGKVINKLRIVSSELIELEEYKKQFDAHFENRFQRVPGGTRYTVVAEITLKGPYKVLEPFLRPYVRRQITRFVINPMKLAAER
jgi:hypothetical protein